MGESRKAIEYYESGLAIAIETGDRWNEVNHLGNIGNSCCMMGEVLKAIDYYERALFISREIGDRRNEGIWLAALGEAFEKLDQLEKAIEFTKAAYEIFIQIESPYTEQARKKLAEWQGDDSQK
jgi:tetratricopeptide (TPR) repeat protein